MTSFLEEAVPEALRSIVDAPRTAPAKPFRSLEALRFADEGLLVARGREIEQLVRLVTMYRGVLLYGESGSGKSSIINAGVLPRLIREGFWPHRVRVRRLPGQEFALEPIVCSDADGEMFLPSAFAAATGHGQVEYGAGGFVAAVAAATEHGPILLVFDQFEELATLFPRGPGLSDQQQAIVDAIVTLLRGRPPVDPGAEDGLQPVIPVKLLFSFREDYLASLKPLFERRPELIHQGVRLTAPPLSCAPEIIRGPFQEFPGAYVPDLSPLAEDIATALGEGNESGETPLSELQIVCSRLYEAKRDPAVELERGVKKLLEDHLTDALAQFEGTELDAAIAVLNELVTTSDTRNVVARETLIEDACCQEQPGLDRAVVEQTLNKLEHQSGLIRRELRHDVELYELTSEFLIPWISAQRRELEAERERRAQEKARREAERRARVRQRRLALTGLLLLIFVALAIAVYESERRASHDAAISRDEQLQATAQSLLNSEPDASLVFALAAYRGNPSSPAARGSLVAALEQAALSPSSAILHGSLSAVTSVAFDPKNPRLLAAASASGEIRLWDVSSRRRPMATIGPLRSGVFSVAFSPDGLTLAAGTADGSVHFYAVKPAGVSGLGSPVKVQRGIVVSLAFSPDDRLLAAAGLDESVALVKLKPGQITTQAPVRTLGVGTAVRSIAFDPWSGALASVTNGGWIYLWNPMTRRLIVRHRISHAALYSVAFNPASRSAGLGAGGLDGNVYIWRPGSHPVTVPGSGGRGAIDSVAFSPDGAKLAVGGAGETIRLFNLRDGRAVAVPLAGHEGVVTAVAFNSPAGRMLASASTDQTVRLWSIPVSNQFGRTLPATVGAVNAEAYGAGGHVLVEGGVAGVERWAVSDGAPVGPPFRLWSATHVRTVAVSPLDGTIAAATQHGLLRLWNSHGLPIGPVINVRSPINSVAFDPAARRLAFAGKDGQLRLWSYPAGQPRPLGHATDRIFSVAFSPNGRILASAGDDRVIRLLNPDTGAEISRMSGDSDAIFSVNFDPTGQLLASGSADGTVRLWSVTKGREIGLPLLGHHGFVRSVAFGDRGRMLASGSFDGTIRLWDVVTATPIGQPLGGDGRQVQAVAFSPNGLNVVGGGDDGTRVWPLILLRGYRAMRARVCGLLGDGLSQAEWTQFAPHIKWENPC